MSRRKRESFFWTSYSDLMTSLFFVMLTLFVLSIAVTSADRIASKERVSAMRAERDASKAEIQKINEIRTAIQSIDPKYFEYNEQYKKHILKTVVKFRTGSSDIDDLDDATRYELIEVRGSILEFLSTLYKKDKNASYLLIIEGQASKDQYSYNNQLSYERALSLFRFWFPDDGETTLRFGNYPCEVVIAGAGCMEGKPRAQENSDNQRFLIQIIPKPGLIGD